MTISIISFFLSLWNFFTPLYNNRSKLTVSLEKVTNLSHLCDKPFIFRMTLENRSRLSISVSRMFLSCNNKTFEFEWLPRSVASTVETAGDDKHVTHHCSVELPYTIQGLGAAGKYFWVYTCNSFNCHDLVDYPVFLTCYTNRGIKKIKLNISENTFKIV